MTDVNTAFDAQRMGQIQALQDARADYQSRVADFESGAAQAALDSRLSEQVAAGKIKMLGTDRYEVMEGFDRGEIFSVRRAVRPGELSLIEPEHGLDMSTGQAALYSAQPEWHGLGNIIPGGTTDIDKVLELGGIAYPVSVRDARYYFGGKLRKDPDHFHTVREDTGASLGVVGKIYRPIQNRDGFTFIQELLAKEDLIWESAGALRGGKRAFISTRLPADVVIDAGGIADTVVPHVVFINSFDGNTPLLGLVTPWRPRCGNTERLAVSGAITRWTARHTANALNDPEDARRTLGLTVKYYEQFAAEETQLARTAMAMSEVDELIASMWPLEEDATKTQRTIAGKRRDTLLSRFDGEVCEVGRTAYAAERMVTGYLDNDKTRRGESKLGALLRATVNLEGVDDELKTKAHKQLMTLSNR